MNVDLLQCTDLAVLAAAARHHPQGQVRPHLRHLLQVLQAVQHRQAGALHRRERQPHPDRLPEPAGPHPELQPGVVLPPHHRPLPLLAVGAAGALQHGRASRHVPPHPHQHLSQEENESIFQEKYEIERHPDKNNE